MPSHLDPIKSIELPNIKPIETQSVPKKQSLREWAMAGGGVPASHKGRTDVWHKKVRNFAAGGEVFNTVPDISDSGQINEGPAFARGGDVRMGAGGFLKRAIKNMQKTLPAAEREANKARFLESSKVKQPVYHGTMRDVQEFRTPAYFGGKGVANQFADPEYLYGTSKLEIGEAPNVMPVHLNLKNPKIFTKEADYEKHIMEGGLNAGRWKSKGHDGVIYAPSGDMTSPDAYFVAFEPEQIKSAIGNRGTYDINEADITKADGGDVHMEDGGAAFGVFPQMKPKRSKQDPEAAKNAPLDFLRGRIAGTLGMPGDIESLIRMLPGLDERTYLPTSEDIEQRLPFRSDAPVSRAAAGLGSLTANPMDLVRAGKAATKAAKAAKPAVGQALEDYMFKQGLALPAVETSKPTKAFKFPQDKALKLAQERASLPIEQGGLGLPVNNTPEMRAEAMGAVDWLHGTERLDRLLEKKNLDPRKSTSGPMPYGTNAGELASNYAMNKADTSLSAIDTGEMPNYFQVFPKSMGQRGSSPRSVESVWYSLPQEKKAEILEKAKRVGYENFDEATGPLTLHPEGVNAMNVAEDTWNYYLNRESKGNPLAALRAIWGESGTLFGQEEKLADIYKLAGFPYEISQTNAPWTTAKGVMTGKAMISNPLNTSNTVEIQEKVIPFLKEQFKNDRTRKKDFGADQWDKNFRYTPKEWISTLEDDIAAGNNSYVWTSIPDKVTQSLKKAGYNGIIDKSGKGGGVQEDVIIPFEPEQLRSRFAAFDPFRKTAATAAAMGVAAPDLLAEENKASGGSVNLDAMYMAVNDAKFRRK
jgi:hypothetical protein